MHKICSYGITMLPTWFILADVIVLHVAPVVIPLVKVGTPEARIGCWLMIHHNTLFTSTGRFISIPVSAKYRAAGTLLSDFACSILTSSRDNRNLPLSSALWVAPFASSGSLLTGTGNYFHRTTGRDLGRHQMFAPLHFSKALSRNHHQKSRFLALSGFATCFLLTSVLLHSQGWEGLPLRSHKPGVPPESSLGWIAHGSRPSCSRDVWNQQNIPFGLKKKDAHVLIIWTIFIMLLTTN